MKLVTIIALLVVSVSARGPYQPGEKCAGAPGRPEIAWADPPCTPGYECSGAASDWGKTCVKVGDGCDDGDDGGGRSEEKFPRVRLPYSNRCTSQSDCPTGSTCAEVTPSFGIASGTFACTDFTRGLGETCHRASKTPGESLFPSPGCRQNEGLICSPLPGKESEPAVCRKLVGLGGACGDGKGLEFCLDPGRRRRELACVEGKCQYYWTVVECNNGACPAGQVCRVDKKRDPTSDIGYCAVEVGEGEMCTWQAPDNTLGRLRQCKDTAAGELWCVADPAPTQFTYQGTCVAGITSVEANARSSENLKTF